MTKPFYPNVTVQLTSKDDNAFSILANVARELRKHGVHREEIDDFMNEAMSADYNKLLRVCMEWVNVK